MNIKCGQCAFRLENNNCGLTNFPVEDWEFCSKAQINPERCAICEGIIPKGAIIDVDTKKVFCQRCVSLMTSCQMCVSGEHCAFNEDPSPLPKMVQTQTRQGPMVVSTTIRNPERVAATCEKSCKCYDNGECMREYNYCKNHIDIISKILN